jgi:hypothetical protein
MMLTGNMADANDIALAVVVKHSIKTLLDMIGTFCVNQSMSELFASLNVNSGDLIVTRVQVAASENGAWRDVDQSIAVATLTTFNTRHVR